jgi:hypothetical protein
VSDALLAIVKRLDALHADLVAGRSFGCEWFDATEDAWPAISRALTERIPRERDPEHVCGLQGFGALGDSCPACALNRRRYEEKWKRT